MPAIFAQHGLTSGITTSRSHFHLNDEKYLRTEILRAGFKNVKVFYTPSNMTFFSAEEYLTFLESGPAFKNISEEMKAQIIQEFTDVFETRFGNSSDQVLDWEVLVAIAEK